MAAKFRSRRVEAAYHLGNVGPRYRIVAGIFALGRECDKKRAITTVVSTRCLQPARVLFQNRDQ
jgi:hypothetical protein